MTEADTCRKYVVPKLQAAGWEDEPHSIALGVTASPRPIVSCVDQEHAEEGDIERGHMQTFQGVETAMRISM